MKRQTLTSLLVAVLAALTFTQAAHAGDLGQGSIRMTIALEDAEHLGIRYTTENEQIQNGMKPSEVLRLSSFDIENNILWPSTNSFTLVKGGNTLVIGVQGEQDQNLVRLNFDEEGLQEELYLPSDIEIGTLEANKVEILDENDQVVAEVTDELKEYTSVNGMAIRFAIAEEDANDDQGDGDGNGNVDVGPDDLAPGDGEPASGGCTMVPGAAGSVDMSAAAALAGLALAAWRRLKK